MTEKKKTEDTGAAKPKAQPPAAAPKAAKKTEKAEAKIYAGPTLRGGRLAKATIFKGGVLTRAAAELAKEHKAISRLIIPVSRLGSFESKLKDPTTIEAAAYAEAARLFVRKEGE